jgi:hypothetical protein
MLNCSKCGVAKPENDFSVRADRARGYNSHCKQCVRLVNKISYDKNKVARRAAASAYRVLHPPTDSQYQKEYRDAHRDESRVYHREYACKYPDKKSAVSVARRARKLKATPLWADSTKVARFYTQCKIEEKLTGLKMHVDHIIPLVHPLVCGLHNEFNLQILTASEICTRVTNLR